jgi:hypothetical protein
MGELSTELSDRNSRLRIRNSKKKKKKIGADNIPQYVRRKNLKQMPTQRPNPKGTFQNKLTSEDKTDNQKVWLLCVRLHDSLNGIVKTIEIL